MSKKKFIEITNELGAMMFFCEKTDGDSSNASANVDYALQAIIDSGLSAAIPRALYLKMAADPKEEVEIEIGPFKYGISMKKVGDTVTFNPTFSLTAKKKLLAELDAYEAKVTKLDGIVDRIAREIKDETLIDCIIHCCKLDEFDTIKAEWVEKVDDSSKGAELDVYSAVTFMAIHIVSILHVLATSRSSEEVVKYEVPGEGTYTISASKGDEFDVGFIASKEYKQSIKNDRLISNLTE